ncbi:MAG: Nif3-like dinuclear metal center hexameric protein [Oscillospiraceae bacterium]|jgi:dinuclear metal center YbgI/SA1388 family protein|nr:Nif3-like dinuclear metal center hexameric protein [Oscillospiraceae bacterium]
MTKISDILEYLDKKAPMTGIMPKDNVGLLVGDGSRRVSDIMLALDITTEVIEEAANFGAELIVSHHPVIRDGLKSLTPESNPSVYMLAEHKIAAICMHTNLDAAKGGVNDALAKTAGLTDYDTPLDDYNIGRVGTLPNPVPLSEYLPALKTALNANGLQYFDAGKTVKRVAVCGGSGADFCNEELMKQLGFDTLLTSDLKHHTWLDAKRLGLNIIDGGHYCTENVIVPVLRDWLADKFPELELKISERHVQIDRFI